MELTNYVTGCKLMKSKAHKNVCFTSVEFLKKYLLSGPRFNLTKIRTD